MTSERGLVWSANLLLAVRGIAGSRSTGRAIGHWVRSKSPWSWTAKFASPFWYFRPFTLHGRSKQILVGVFIKTGVLTPPYGVTPLG